MEPPSLETTVAARRRPFRQFLVLLAVGMLGVVTLLPALIPVVADLLVGQPGVPELPTWLLALLSLVNPTILLTLGVLIGVALAWRLGLRSHLAAWAAGGASPWARIGQETAPSLVAGVIVAVLLVLGNALTLPFMGEHAHHLDVTAERTAYATLMGVLYGGLTEELQMRWGVMTLLAFLLWLPSRRRSANPPAFVMSAAILLSAVVFGLLHLPAVAGIVGTLETPVVLRTVVLNALGGIVFGWLFWKRSLESAMIGHGSSHVALTLIALLLHADH